MASKIEKDILREQKIKKNTKLFIIDRKLKEYHMDRESVDCLPAEAYYGTIYLIKGQTIFQVTSQPELELVVDFSDNWRALFHDKVLRHKSVVNAHNVFIGDINEFANPTQFINMNDMISYDLQKTFNFIMGLIKNNFNIYIIDTEKIQIDINLLKGII